MIAIVIYPRFQILDAAGAMAVFEAANALHASRYDIRIVSVGGGPVISSGGAVLHSSSLEDVSRADTVLVCGGVGAVDSDADPKLSSYLWEQCSDGARVAGICTGAFALAASGLLDGRSATTHWRFAHALSDRFPNTCVTDQIWVRDGRIWTSAGVTAGLDLALALTNDDLGNDLTQQIARELVVHHRRPGGNPQVSALSNLSRTSGRFDELLTWIQGHLDHDLSVDRLAERAAMSPRHFSRAFGSATGVSPARAVERLRLEVAREWISRDTHSRSHIAQAVGFGSTDRMRRAFQRGASEPGAVIRRAY